jgi:hypothetical protein
MAFDTNGVAFARLTRKPFARLTRKQCASGEFLAL